MTVIAANAALPTPSPGPGAGALVMDQGFDALLAVVTATNDPISAKPAPHRAASKPEDRSADRAERKDTVDRPEGVAASVEEVRTAAPDEDGDEAGSKSSDEAALADAAAQAAAMLVAAMVPPAEQTFAAETPPDLGVVAPLQVSLVSALAEGAEPQVGIETVAALTQTPVLASDTAPDAAAQVGPVSVGAPTLNLAATALPVAEVEAPAPDSTATAAIEIPEEALLDAPIAASDAGVDVAALAAPTTPKPSPATPSAQGAVAVSAAQIDVTLEAEPVVIAAVADIDSAPLEATSAVELATATAADSAPVVAQSAAEPAIKVATAALGPNDAMPGGHEQLEPVMIAGVEAGAPTDQDGSDQGGTGQNSSQGDLAAEVVGTAANDAAATPEAPILAPTSTTSTGSAAAAAPAQRAETRGSPETVAQLSAEILKKLDARTTRFDVALTPAGLGKVDVRIEIGRHGALTASMAFDTVQAAAELRGKAHELRQALSQAGFTIADNALRFDVSSQGGQSGQNAFFSFNGGEDGRRAWSGKAFQAAQNDDAPLASVSDLLPGLRVTPDSGLDIRI